MKDKNLLSESAQYGIMSVPAIAINGELKFMGVPKKEELKKALQEELNNESGFGRR